MDHTDSIQSTRTYYAGEEAQAIGRPPMEYVSLTLVQTSEPRSSRDYPPTAEFGLPTTNIQSEFDRQSFEWVNSRTMPAPIKTLNLTRVVTTPEPED